MSAHEVPGRRVAIAGLAMAGLVLAAVLAVTGLLRHWQMPWHAAPPRPPMLDAPADSPALQTAPQPDRQRLQAEQQARLHGWGWVDAAHGVARIPIDEAINLLAATRPASAP